MVIWSFHSIKVEFWSSILNSRKQTQIKCPQIEMITFLKNVNVSLSQI